MSPDLSPCPFCGGGASHTMLAVRTHFIRCSKCNAATGLCDTEAEAIARWNARPGAAKADPAPGTVRVVRRYKIWSDGVCRVMDPGEDDPVRFNVVASVTLTAHVVTVTADLPLPPAPVVVAGTVETS